MKHIVCNQNEFFGPWICKILGIEWFTGRGQTVGLLDSEKGPIACALYEGHNGASVMVHLAKAPDASLCHEFIWYGSYYPFVELGVNVLIAPVESTNSRSIKFTEHYGFTLGATLKDAAVDGDLLLYTMKRDDCPWLSLKGFSHGKAEHAESS